MEGRRHRFWVSMVTDLTMTSNSTLRGGLLLLKPWAPVIKDLKEKAHILCCLDLCYTWYDCSHHKVLSHLLQWIVSRQTTLLTERTGRTSCLYLSSAVSSQGVIQTSQSWGHLTPLLLQSLPPCRSCCFTLSQVQPSWGPALCALSFSGLWVHVTNKLCHPHLSSIEC